MKKLLPVFLLFAGLAAYSQDKPFSSSVAEAFSTSGKTVFSKEVFKDRYSGAIGNMAYVSLVRFTEFPAKDTVYGLQLSGNILDALVSGSSFMRDFKVLLDYSDLQDMLEWVKLVNENRGNKEFADMTLTLNLKHSPLCLRVVKNSLEVQYNRYDAMTVSELGSGALDKLQEGLATIESKWPQKK
jgi:hypothetical protein